MKVRQLILADFDYSNLPAGVCVIAIVLLFVPLGQPSEEASQGLPLHEKFRHMDAPGLVLFIGAICCLLLALTWGGHTYPWNDQKIIGLFVGFGTIALCFCYWLVRQGELALIPVRVLKKRSVYVGAATLLGFGVISVVVSISRLIRDVGNACLTAVI